MMIDTQVLSYSYKGQNYDVKNARISSVVAKEFLEIYDTQSATSDRYYIIYRHGQIAPIIREAPATYKSKLLDQIVFDFANDYPALIELGSRSVADIINDRNVFVFNKTVDTIDKDLRKRLKPRFAFLCREAISCVPLSTQTAGLGLELLSEFAREHNIKNSLRNSVNDMMILASALSSRDELYTKDSLLLRFMASRVGARISPSTDSLVLVNFAVGGAVSKYDKKESKGYINRGWSIAESKRRTP